MRVLFLHSGTELTGSMTYAKALQSAWSGRHEVFWCHDGIEGTDAPNLRLPLRAKLFPRGFLNAKDVTRFVKDQKIEVMHAHSRRSAVVAALVSKATAVPYVLTAHLCPPAHASSRLWPCLGHHTIAICDTIRDYLIDTFRLRTDRVSLIRNGIDLDRFAPQTVTPPPTRWISVVGRLSGRRWRSVPFLLPIFQNLLTHYADVQVRFVGLVADEHREEFQAGLENANRAFNGPRIHAVGQVADLRPILATSTVVVGAGRSLMEAMAMERPVVAVGEQTAHGLVFAQTFAAVKATNFGDFVKDSGGKTSYQVSVVRDALKSVLDGTIQQSSLGRWARQQVSEHYDIRQVAAAVDEVYQKIRQGSV